MIVPEMKGACSEAMPRCTSVAIISLCARTASTRRGRWGTGAPRTHCPHCKEIHKYKVSEARLLRR
jgi:hypothetical protein